MSGYQESITEALGALESLRGMETALAQAAAWCAQALSSGRKVLACGNGGSAAEAQHLVGELMGRYKENRPALAAVALNADAATLTCIGNDYRYDEVFERQLRGLGKAGDVLVAFTTSGNSANVLAALRAAREMGIRSVAFLGRDGGAAKELADCVLLVPRPTARAQEAHQVLLHCLMDAIERQVAAPADKRRRLEALSTPSGVIAALAMDQRLSLRKMIAAARGVDAADVPDAHLVEFKSAVTRLLSPLASAVLLDPEYGLPAAGVRASGCGLLLTYEMDGFENPRPHRMLALLPRMSVRRLAELGGAGVKILLSWDPNGDGGANEEKRALVERIGSECAAAGMPFFLEPVVYDAGGQDPKGFEFAQRKPELVARTMAEFSRPEYGVDVLKVEFPVNVAFVEGSAVYRGRRAQTMAEALECYRAADSAARCPYIYLSAGASNPEFVESLRLAAQAGARFSGVLCGRAHWQDGVREYVRGGLGSLEAWLAGEGARNVAAVNECLTAAAPWKLRTGARG